jgi:hypothetical protein
LDVVLCVTWYVHFATAERRVYIPAFSSHMDYLFTYECAFTQLCLNLLTR